MMKSIEIKFALLWYFRFQRQWLCATECHLWDVIVFTNKYMIEVEVKVSKSDLWNGEAKKDKHEKYKLQCDYFMPNKFYVCIPQELQVEAEKWVEATNKNYGIIICRSLYNLIILRKAKILKEGYAEDLKNSMLKRLCTENIFHLRKQLTKDSLNAT